MSGARKGYPERCPAVRAAAWALCLGGLLAGAAGCQALRGREGPIAYVGDARIAARIDIDLVHDPQIDAREIDVQSDHGTVTLDGTVDSEATARAAVRIARKVPGVRAVVSRLKVAAHPVQADPADR